MTLTPFNDDLVHPLVILLSNAGVPSGRAPITAVQALELVQSWLKNQGLQITETPKPAAPNTFNLVLSGCPLACRIPVMQAIRIVTGEGLRTAADMVASAATREIVLLSSVNEENARQSLERLLQAGAAARLVPNE